MLRVCWATIRSIQDCFLEKARCFRGGGRKATARMLILSLDALVWVESRSMGKVLKWKPKGRIQGASCGFRVIRSE
jgi:hypothetical protein